jgi:hypothetical protein
MKLPSKALVIALFASALGLTALSISGQSTKNDSSSAARMMKTRIVEYEPSTTKPRTFRLKAHGETIAEITIANLKGVTMEITSDQGVIGETGKVRNMRLSGGAQIELKVQGGDPIRITAEEIEYAMPAPKK